MKLLLRWGFVLGVLAVAGCDSSVCTNRDVNGNCPEFDGPPDLFDATVRDGSVGDSGRSDGALPDAAIVGIDSSVPDAAVVDATVTPAVMTLQQFCEARYVVAKAWRDQFEACCFNNDVAAREDILRFNLGYQAIATTDSVEACATSIAALPPANLTFVGTAAGACAAKLAAQFAAPDATCPAGGFDAQSIEATLGHQQVNPVQLAECRAALVGNVVYNGACTNPFECKSGYRCLGVEGAKTCRDPLSASAACTSTAECADGLLCVTSAGSTTGKVCRSASEPIDVTVACSNSAECAVGLRCNDAGKCAAPVAELICK